jgi:hypothetical protein
LQASLSQESIYNYQFMETEVAHKNGVDIVMTTMLDSDVPVPYFSYVEYNFFEPAKPKTEDASTCAFISAGSNNDRDSVMKVARS